MGVTINMRDTKRKEMVDKKLDSLPLGTEFSIKNFRKVLERETCIGFTSAYIRIVIENRPDFIVVDFKNRHNIYRKVDTSPLRGEVKEE